MRYLIYISICLMSFSYTKKEEVECYEEVMAEEPTEIRSDMIGTKSKEAIGEAQVLLTINSVNIDGENYNNYQILFDKISVE